MHPASKTARASAAMTMTELRRMELQNVRVPVRRAHTRERGRLLVVRFGIVVLPTDPWATTRARARHIEALGYDHLWTYDHLSWRHYREEPWYASLIWLTGLAAATETIRIGPLVSSPNFRHPVNLAKEVMTLDHVSDGRVILGLGAGGPGFDSTVLGGELLPPAPRVSRLAEFVAVVDQLLREPRVSHAGEWYTVDEARMIPGCVQQPRVPIALAAGGPRTFALAARYADSWIIEAGSVGTPETPEALDGALAERHDALTRACEAIDRDPASIDRLYMHGWEHERPIASASAFADFAARMQALGFTDVVVTDPRPGDQQWNDPVEVIDEIATTVLPEFRRAAPPR
jgi:alkanesulfonate monooxygenase SsuD/methylene tetrahydromethanopterin reductase-like flavin-dependent oxidoreductase (luciferase family)